MARSHLAAVFALAPVLLLMPACGGHGTSERDRPYAGLEKREIKALPPDRVADLLAGEGLGYALAAELNRYPGPAHALELGEELELTAEQASALRRIKADVHAEAKPLGRQLIDLERELDRAFRSGRAATGGLARLTAAIANVEGRIRFIHLRGHIEAEDLLTGHQIAAYDRLRGYADAGHGHENDQEYGR